MLAGDLGRRELGVDPDAPLGRGRAHRLDDRCGDQVEPLRRLRHQTALGLGQHEQPFDERLVALIRGEQLPRHQIELFGRQR